MQQHYSRRTRGAALVGIAAIGSLVLAGCAGSPNESGNDSEPVTISYLHRLPDGEGMTKSADLAAEWNADNPDIQVETTKFDGQSQEMIKKLEADVNAGTAPCLAQLSEQEVPEMYVKGLTEDVTEYVEQYRDNFNAAPFENTRVGDVYVGLPQDVGPLVYFYNKSEFERLGLSVPADLDEFVETARAAASQGKYIVAFEPDEALNWLTGQASAAGSEWFTTDGDTWVVDTEDTGSGTVSAFWQTLLDEDSAIVQERWADGFGKALNDQQLIGTIGAVWETPLLVDAMSGTANDGQWSVAQLPDFGSGKTGSQGGSVIAVMKGCEYPEQALAFANWFNTQVDALASQGLVVAAKETPDTPEDIKAFFGGQDVFAELTAAAANEAPFDYIPYFSTLRTPMVEAAVAAGAGTGSVADIFSAAQQQAVDTLSSAGLSVKE